jgi:hypothetical protein
MKALIMIAAVVVVWVLINRWLLPKLGIKG